MAEVLPNNANTAKILKEREEEAERKAQREAAVSEKPSILGGHIVVHAANLTFLL